nr:hypothetical protein [Fodinicola feengrottensis]
MWLGRDGERIAVHDLFRDTYVLLTDSDTGPLPDLSAPVRIYRIGRDLIDLETQWPSRYGSGSALIRPDGYIAWRST